VWFPVDGRVQRVGLTCRIESSAGSAQQDAFDDGDQRVASLFAAAVLREQLHGDHRSVAELHRPRRELGPPRRITAREIAHQDDPVGGRVVGGAQARPLSEFGLEPVELAHECVGGVTGADLVGLDP
jgi:hypothetical protein